MDERVKALLTGTATSDLDTIAAGALGVPSANAEGPLVMAPVKGHIADPRTLGVIRVSGSALVAGVAKPWSAVAKCVDLSGATVGEVEWTRPEIEEIVYEKGHFAGDGQPFRPARCYLVSRPAAGVKVIWLEDLSEAEQPPFGVDQLADMARDLGEWSAFHQNVPELGFPLYDDIYQTRWQLPAFVNRYARIKALDPGLLAPFYRDVPIDMLETLRGLFLANNERAKALPHGLAFGDCHVGNLFHRPGETIAVDWASLARDPIGADAGSMIGSTLGRGSIEAARNERALFEIYLDGLRAQGWQGNRDDVRRGYFCQFGHYLASTVGLMPVAIGGDWPIADVAMRMGVAADDIPGLLAEIIALYPSYVEELQDLAAR